MIVCVCTDGRECNQDPVDAGVLASEARYARSTVLGGCGQVCGNEGEPSSGSRRVGDRPNIEHVRAGEANSEHSVYLGICRLEADESNQQAFIKLMDLYGLFGGSGFPIDEGDSTTLGRLRMIIEEERQYRCAGFVQAEIDRYADEMKDGDEESGEAEEGVISDEDDDGSDASEDDEAPTRKRQKTGVKKRKQQKARARKEQGLLLCILPADEEMTFSPSSSSQSLKNPESRNSELLIPSAT